MSNVSGSIVTQAYSWAPGIRLYADSSASARAPSSVSTEIPLSCASAASASPMSRLVMSSCLLPAPRGPTRTRCGPARCRRSAGCGSVPSALVTVTVSSSACGHGAIDPAVALGAGLGLDLHLGAERAPEVDGGAQGPLEARGAHLEGVVTVDRVVLVEGAGQLPGDLGQGVDVGAAVTVDEDPEDPAGQLQVVQLQPGGLDEGRDEVLDAGSRSTSPSPPPWARQSNGVGRSPRRSSNFETIEQGWEHTSPTRNQ